MCVTQQRSLFVCWKGDAVKNEKRFIAWSTDSRDVKDVCASIDRLLLELGFAGANLVDPHPDPIKKKEAVLRAVWGGSELRNERIRNTLGMEFRPLDVSLHDCVEFLLSIGKVEPKSKLKPES